MCRSPAILSAGDDLLEICPGYPPRHIHRRNRGLFARFGEYNVDHISSVAEEIRDYHVPYLLLELESLS
jgi:hypothetical protein